MLLVFVMGVLLGTLVTRWVASMGRRHAERPYIHDSQYLPAQRAVARHLRFHGTVNVQELARMMDINLVTSLQYLEQMVAHGLIRRQGHRGKGSFYTLR